MKFCPQCGRGNPPESTQCERCSTPLTGAVAPPVDRGPAAHSPSGTHEYGLSPGAQVDGGRYIVERHLGTGGMGAVYLANDVRLNRPVAIKLMKRELIGHRTARARMEREAQALANINHPNVIDIYNVLDHAGTVALVLEYVAGGTLTDKLARGPVHWSDAIILLAGVLDGLQVLHNQSLVHRDMKPDNVLLDAVNNTPKITDLGVAHVQSRPGLTRQGSLLGTLEYMSPEQIRAMNIDHRTDIYAVGIILYELLVGQVPFAYTSTFEMEKAHCYEIPDLNRLPRDLPVALRELIGSALGKSPEERPQSADAMRSALLALAGGGSAQPPQLPTPPTVKVDHIPAPAPKPRESHLPIGQRQGTVIRVLSGAERGNTLVVHSQGVTVGRSSDNDLVLSDPMVSSDHLKIELRRGVFHLVDLGSSNGTHVNGARVSVCQLTDGMTITMGPVELLWQSDAQASPPPKPKAPSSRPQPQGLPKHPAQPEVAPHEGALEPSPPIDSAHVLAGVMVVIFCGLAFAIC